MEFPVRRGRGSADIECIAAERPLHGGAEQWREGGMDSRDHRLDGLETKIAYMEKALADLDGLVVEYGRRADRAEARLDAVVRRLSELSQDKQPGMPPSERPPHY